MARNSSRERERPTDWNGLPGEMSNRAEGMKMNPTKLAGIALIVLGCLGLAYGGFSYTRETTPVKIGSLELKVEEQKNVNVPLIVSAGAVVLGVFLLVTVGRK
jgi:uncharacterized membrane protein YidH (DUF202 family)